MSTEETGSGPPRRRFSIAQLALIVPWVALIIDAWSPIRDNSFLWHIRAGTLQAETGEVITTDPFSFTRNGAEWVTQSWLAELLYGWGEQISGLGFVPWMLLVVTTLTFIGIGLVAYRYSGSTMATAFVLVLSTLVLISFLVPRPVIFSYLLFVLVILAWDRARTRWAVPFLFWIWASVHGSFVIGLAYVGLSLAMRREWKALPTAIVGGAATLITAHGLGVLEVLAEFARAREFLSLLSEWRRPSVESPVFLGFLGGVGFIVIGAWRRHIAPIHLWLLVPFLILGFSSLRAVPPAWLGILPLVALALSGMEIGTLKRVGAVPATLFAIAVVGLPLLLIEEPALAEDRFPIEARHGLADVPTFHDDRVGGYLIWAEWPERLVYLDDRAELYLERVGEFADIRSGDLDWRPIFERDGIRQALLHRDEQLVADLTRSGWATVHEDENYVVLRP